MYLMKSLAPSMSLLALTALLLAGCSADPSTSNGPVASAPADGASVASDAETMHLTVYGMSCPLCATNIDKQLLRVEGVEHVAVDMSTGIVTLTVDPANPPSAEALEHAVVESGFTLAQGPVTTR